MVTEAATAPQDKPPSFPVFKNREELSDYARKLGFKKIEEFESALGSVQQREKLVEALRKRDPKLNGQVDALISHLKLNHQEIARKERWYEKVLKLPGRTLKATWETVKAHPYLTAAAVAALLVAGAYYTGLGSSIIAKVQSWISAGADTTVGNIVGETLPEVVPSGVGSLPPGASPLGAPPPIPLPFSPMPPPVPPVPAPPPGTIPY